MLKAWLTLLVLQLAGGSLLAVADREIEAKEVALAWLTLIDAGDYGKALDQTDPVFRESITRKDWIDGLTQVRKPLGEVETRRLLRLFATTLLPDSPEGDYVVVNFRTEFTSRKDPVNEIIVVSANPETPPGSKPWRVIGYYFE